MKHRANRISLTDTQRILFGFLGAILLGTVLLMLPVSSASGESAGLLNALFTATTSVCVTGLVVVDTYAYWSVFGKCVILFLIQIGGLGILSLIVGFAVIFRKRASLQNRMLLKDAFNLEGMSGISYFVRRVFLGTLIVEGAGALLSMPVFVRDFGVKGIFISIFHSISAFCNAGIDILGANSLMDYTNDVWLNLVTMALIIAGGIGYIVWWDVLDVIHKTRKGKLPRGHFFRKLSLHSKITLTTTAILLVAGWVLFAAIEWMNPDTIGTLPIHEKLLAALFQSVTTRTAGFATIDQGSLKSGSFVVSLILMFIGGSSVGTAGGIKTSTFAVLALTLISVVKGRKDVTVFHRTLETEQIRQALSIFFISLSTLLVATVFMTVCTTADLDSAFYEVASALGTVGLTCGLTAECGTVGKLLLIVCMYFGRVGPISLALAFTRKQGDLEVKYPKDRLTIG